MSFVLDLLKMRVKIKDTQNPEEIQGYSDAVKMIKFIGFIWIVGWILSKFF